MKKIIIHYRPSHAKHIPLKGLRSSIRLFVTCKVCQRLYFPAITRPNV